MTPKPGGKQGIPRLIAATGYSLKGFRAAFRHEEAFRLEVMLCGIGVICALMFARNFVEGVILVIPLILMLVAELANSAIEAIVDRIGPEHHELSGRAKDIGSATVFLTFGFTIIVWGVFLFQRFLA